jgi:Tol biopolymer transport system component
VAALRYDPGSDRGDLEVFDLATGRWRAVTHRPGFYWAPCWTPDGQRLIYSTTAHGEPLAVFEQALAGGEPHRLFDAGALGAESVTSDGRFVIVERNDPQRAAALWALPLDGRAPFVLDRGPGTDDYGVVSPDGRWLAYNSNNEGHVDVVVQPFPDGSVGATRAQRPAGVEPRWRGDSRELYFLAADGHLTAMAVEPGPPLRLGPPRPLFELPRPWVEFDATPAGDRFLVQLRSRDAPPPTLTVIVDWRPPR